MGGGTCTGTWASSGGWGRGLQEPLLSVLGEDETAPGLTAGGRLPLDPGWVPRAEEELIPRRARLQRAVRSQDGGGSLAAENPGEPPGLLSQFTPKLPVNGRCRETQQIQKNC